MDKNELEYPLPRLAPLIPPLAYSKLRDEPPRMVTLNTSGQRVWLITKYDDVRAVLTDRRMSSDHSTPNYPRLLPVPPIPGMMSFLRMDDPDHARLRRLLSPEFSGQRVNNLRPVIQATVDRLLDEMEKSPAPVDLVEAVSLPMPSLVICQLLGVPFEDHDFFQETSGTIVSAVAGPEKGAAALGEMAAYLDDLVSRREKDPTDDLLGRLAARVKKDELSHDELVSMMRLLLIAGHETVAGAFSLSVFALLRDADQLAMLKEDPSLFKPAVDELLRFFTVIQGDGRVASEDVEVGGQLIAKGDSVIFSLLSANYDESVFPNAATIDLHRDARRHFAFGLGVHQCLGQALARVELEISLASLFRRFPTLRLATEIENIPFRGDMLVYGAYEMPVTW
ncbi:cytochrome P450 [Saccharopolyspora pogona]|uniref:cytochrome P450 n=1 Tax=Saccharopolyspora pogona TaxID=333966 RepID=UPI0016821D71|nr:cytochrome P450 [Saccharopolyspora pogona]